MYVEIHDGMTNIAMYVANASNTKLQLWVDLLEALKRAVLKSLGKVVRQVIKASKVCFQLTDDRLRHHDQSAPTLWQNGKGH